LHIVECPELAEAIARIGKLADELREPLVVDVVPNRLAKVGLDSVAGLDVLDAPVSGGRPAAEARTLTTMVGGPWPVAQLCEPVFRSFSSHVVHLGAPGAGQTVKLLNNALLMVNRGGIAEIVGPGGRGGASPLHRPRFGGDPVNWCG
jgi:hypothetical protein